MANKFLDVRWQKAGRNRDGEFIDDFLERDSILAEDNWQTLSIPRAQSEEYNRQRWGNG